MRIGMATVPYREIERRPSHQELREAYAAPGGSTRSLGEHYSVHPSTMGRWLSQAGVVLRAPGRPPGWPNRRSVSHEEKD